MKYTFIWAILMIGLLSNCKSPELSLPNDFVDESFWVKVDKAHLYTSARGNASDDGVIIIHVHGGPAEGAHGFYFNRPLSYKAMEEEGIVVYYDQRGLGLSTGNFSKDSYTVEQSVKDLDMVVDVARHKFGLEKPVFLFGRSWGGTLTLRYLLNTNLQQKITGWICSNGATDLPLIKFASKELLIEVANEQIGMGNSVGKWEELKSFATNFNPVNASNDAFSDLTIKAVEGMEQLKSDGLIVENNTNTWLSDGEINKHTAYSYTEIFWNDIQGIPDEIYIPLLDISVADQVHRIELPTLIVWGEYDLLVPKQLGVTLFEAISTPVEDKYFHVYENIGHNSMTAPHRYTNHFKTFVNQYK